MIDAEVKDGEYRCAMCGGIFQFIEGADEKARAEAEQNGFDLAECVTVCDDCYKLMDIRMVGQNEYDS